MSEHSGEFAAHTERRRGWLHRRLLDRIYDLSEDPRNPPKWAMLLVLGAGDDGEFYLPCLGQRSTEHGHGEPWWDVPLDLHRPAHWPYALLSAATGWLVFVEPC